MVAFILFLNFFFFFFFFSNLTRFVICASALTLFVLLAGIGKDFSSIAFLSLGLGVGAIPS